MHYMAEVVNPDHMLCTVYESSILYNSLLILLSY